MANIMKAQMAGSLYDKPAPEEMVANPPSTTLFTLDSGDRYNPTDDNISPTTTKTDNRYNNFVIAKNQNLLQGKYSRIGITEVRFPYTIPNVNARNRSMWVKLDVAPNFVQLSIPEGFYTGATLATAIQNALNALGTGFTVAYSTDGRFSFSNSSVPAYAFAMSPIQLPNPLPAPGSPAYQALVYAWNSSRSLLDLIGFYPAQPGRWISGNIGSGVGGSPLVGGYADLRYTDYIDIVSQQLTNYQKGRDATTQVNTPRTNLLYRLFIENENSINSPTSVSGTSPFVIYRQINNPKMLRWNSDSSISQVDIALYDMYGDPLYIPTANAGTYTYDLPMPDFQITFLASED